MKKRKLVVVICASLILFLTACGEKEKVEENDVTVKDTTVRYTQSDYFNIPDDDFFQGERLNVTALERNMKGTPAMYILDNGIDDEEKVYAQIVEYSLNNEGDWDMNILCEKSLTKLCEKQKKQGERSFVIDYIVRGDDGNLYALMATSSNTIPRADERGEEYSVSEIHVGGNKEGTKEQEEEKNKVSYSVLQIGEDTDNIRETPLQFAPEIEEISPNVPVTKFHVFEDGTPILVFQNSTAVQFNLDNGVQTSTETLVPDNAFSRNAVFGTQEAIYYSSTTKSFGILDLDTMSVTKNFGGDIEERYKGKEWYYDVCGDNSQMYAFNVSGLYQIRESGKNFSAARLSLDGSFAALENATIYDVQVDEQEAVYVLVRKESKESTEYNEQWEFGIEKYEKQK